MPSWSEMLKVSKSQLTTYLQCPRKYRFQYVEGREWELMPSSLLFGRAVHEAVAFFYIHLKEEGRKPSSDELVERFRGSWDESSNGVSIQLQSKQSLVELLGLGEKLLKLFHGEIRPRKIFGVEMPFTVDLINPGTGEISDVKLVGYLDLVEEDDEGNLIVVETKTAAKRYSDLDTDSRLNGFTYSYAMKQMGLVEKDDSLLFRYDVLVKTKTPALQQVFFTRDQRDDTSFLRQIQEVLRAIEQQAFYPSYGWWCAGCPFQTACDNV